jgi:hypothetical protein
MTQLRAFVDVGGDEQSDATPWGRIAPGLVSTTQDSLRRWGNANHFTPQLLSSYCGPDGQALDVHTDVLSHEGPPLSPDDLWQFIVAQPDGAHNCRPQNLGHRLAEAFWCSGCFGLTFRYAIDLLRLMQGQQPAPSEQEELPF